MILNSTGEELVDPGHEIDPHSLAPSLVSRRSPPISGDCEVHVRTWERVGVSACHSVTSRNFAANR